MVALGYRLCALTSAPWPAWFDPSAERVTYAWSPNADETERNVLYGLAWALLMEAGIIATHADAMTLALWIARLNRNEKLLAIVGE